MCPLALQTADLQPQECHSSFVLVVFIYLFINFTSLYPYYDTAVTKQKGNKTM